MRRMLILCLAASGLLGCSTEAEHYSLVRTQMPGGYTVAAVQKAPSEGACRAAIERYLAPIRATCPDCKVESSTCERSLSGELKALWAGEPVKQYSLDAGAVRSLIAGDEKTAREACEQMAKEVSGKGVVAKCVPPAK